MSSAPLTAENYHLKWDSHLMHLNRSLATLYKHDRFADVMLLSSHPDCLGGPGVPAHKIILSASSKFFATVFELTPHIPSQNGLMYLVLPPSLSRRAIQVLIQYMYSGESTVSNDILNEVLNGGEILKIRGLYRGNSVDSNKNSSSTLPVNNSNISSSSSYITQHDSSLSLNLKIPETKNSCVKNYSRKPQRTKSLSDTVSDKQFSLSVNKDIAIDPEHRKSIISSPISENVECELSKQNLREPLIISTTPDPLTQNPIDRRKSSTGSNYSDCLLQIKEEPNDSCSEKSQPISTHFREVESSKSKIENVEFQGTKANILDETSKDEITIENCDIKLQNIIVSDQEENSTSFHSDYCDEEITPSIESIKNSDEKIQLSLVDYNIPKKRKIELESTANEKKTISNNDQNKVASHGLRCDICLIVFKSPAVWVRHVQQLHTETELAISNEKYDKIKFGSCTTAQEYLNKISKSCNYCGHSFYSYKEMISHVKKEHSSKK